MDGGGGGGRCARKIGRSPSDFILVADTSITDIL